MDLEELMDEINYILVKLNDIQVYNNILDEIDYLNLINSLKIIKNNLNEDENISNIDDAKIWLKNNDIRISYILNKYKHLNTVTHHFY